MVAAFNESFIQKLEQALAQMKKLHLQGDDETRLETITKQFEKIINACKDPKPSISRNPIRASSQRIALLTQLFKMGFDSDVCFHQLPDYLCFQIFHKAVVAPCRSTDDIFPSRSAAALLGKFAANVSATNPFMSLKNSSGLMLKVFEPISNTHHFINDLTQLTELTQEISALQSKMDKDNEVNQESLPTLKNEWLKLVTKLPLFALAENMRKDSGFINQNDMYHFLKNSPVTKSAARIIVGEKDLPEKERIIIEHFSQFLSVDKSIEACKNLFYLLDQFIRDIAEYTGNENIDSPTETTSQATRLSEKKKITMVNLAKELNTLKDKLHTFSEAQSLTKEALALFGKTLSQLMSDSLSAQKSPGRTCDMLIEMSNRLEEFSRNNAMLLDPMLMDALARATQHEAELIDLVDMDFRQLQIAQPDSAL